MQPDYTVKIVSDNPDAEVSVVGNQVIEATPADVGKVVTVAADGSLVLAEGGGGGVTDHGALTGLADDDHSAYSLTSHAHSGTYVPLSLVDAAGDMLQGSADNTLERVAKGSAGQVWRMKADGSKGEFGAPGLLVHVRDERASGTAGGTFTSGAWQARVLNTAVTNEVSGASLASNEITLPAGTYEVDAIASAHLVDGHKARLYNVTGAAELVLGTAGWSGTAASQMTLSRVRGKFTLGAASAVRLEHRCQSTRATDGLGLANSFAVVEVYADVQIRKVG